MIVKIADNIISPLGTTTKQNYQAVLEGCSALWRHDADWGAEPYVASLLDRSAIETLWRDYASCRTCQADLTLFERLAILSIYGALGQCGIDPSSPETLFVLSTTKGNVDQLARKVPLRVSPAESARVIASHFGNPSPALVVSNACTSGLCAQIEAMRALEAGDYRHVIVCGAEVQSPFIVSGFQSFKALSPDECRPFDADRTGLNLGEAAATIIYTVTDETHTGWCATSGAIRNDANHISGPSRTGEGSYQALMAVLQDGDKERLATISLHGTATPYNDEMESIALSRAGLDGLPAGSLKGTFGHTMGAAGVLETILTMRALDDGLLLPTRGYRRSGTSHMLDISNELRRTDRHAFVKLLSGFGGCNAAMRFEYRESFAEPAPQSVANKNTSIQTVGEVRVTPADGTLDSLYRKYIGDYPKYFKMDGLGKLAVVAVQMALASNADLLTPHSGVLLFGHHGSISADTHFQLTIQDADNYYPSPSVFVYTLPNIATGELAIRHHLHGETNVILLDKSDDRLMERYIGYAFSDPGLVTLITGWVDYVDENDYIANIKIITIQR